MEGKWESDHDEGNDRICNPFVILFDSFYIHDLYCVYVRITIQCNKYGY